MSYDLMVFDPAVAPRDRGQFMEWYSGQTEWSEGHSYDDPANTTPDLQAWYNEIRKTYPNMNGPGAPTDDDLMIPGVEDHLADYSIGHHFIYVAFPWTAAEEAYPLVRSLALTYGVGFYDVSGDEGEGEIYFPGDDLRPPSQGQWRQISADFRAGDLSKYISAPEAPKRRWFDFFRRKQ